MSSPQSEAEIAALLARGMEAHRAGAEAAAEDAYRAVLGLDPSHPDALCLLGMVAGAAGRHLDAIAFFRRALVRAPENPDIYHNIGEAWRQLGDLVKADPAFRRAIDLRPDHAESYIGLADAIVAEAAVYERAGRAKESRALRRVAATALLALAKRQHRKKLVTTEDHYKRAAALDPRNVEIFAQWCGMLVDMGRNSEAEAIARRAIALDPRRADAYANLGVALLGLDRPDMAQAAFRKSLSLDPAMTAATVGLTSFRLLAPLYRDATTPAQVLAAHRAWGTEMIAAARQEAAAAPLFANSRDPERRLRIGYVSPDFKNHVVAQFLEPLLAHHDPAAFETFCYANVKDEDDATRRLRGLAAQWRPIYGASDGVFRRMVREDGIDILFELAGHTVDSRLAAFAVKPAPVTANWLGYPATTGLPTIDWRITDGLADPPGAEIFHTERLMRLPECFLCYQPQVWAPEVAPLPASASGRVTFGSANNLAKVTPEVVALWAEILYAVPGSRLVARTQKLADPVARARYLALFEKHGVTGDQLELRQWVFSRSGHLTAYGEIDIALDTFPYNGTTTTCEALWMGVPVVGLVGDRHAGRVGLSLLSQVGLAHLAAPDRAAYVRIAADLAADLPALARLRGDLRGRFAASPLCDAPRFARAFEAALRQMWRDWCGRPS